MGVVDDKIKQRIQDAKDRGRAALAEIEKRKAQGQTSGFTSKWSVEPLSDNTAFLLTPGATRVAHMTRARANGIAAALNTKEGAKAFARGRLSRDQERSE